MGWSEASSFHARGGARPHSSLGQDCDAACGRLGLLEAEEGILLACIECCGDRSGESEAG